MGTVKVQDKSLIWSITLLKIVGVWVPMNKAEEWQTKLALSWSCVALSYSTYLNVVDFSHNLKDLSRCIFSACTILCIFLSISKTITMCIYKPKFKELFLFAQKHFWDVNYEHEEKTLFKKCQKFCKMWIIVICALAQGSLAFYILSPISENIGKNKSERVLPFRMWVDLPLSESPYYELVYTLQAACVEQVGAAYMCSDCFLSLMNFHVIYQFRMLHLRLHNMWPAIDEHTNMNEYANNCYVTLIKCIQKHQLLLEFCNKLNNIYTMLIFQHIFIFSVLMCLDMYEIFLAKIPITTRLIFGFHMSGSWVHIIFFSYCCDGLIEESTNFSISTYSGFWTSLPMNSSGKMIRSNLRIMLMRTLNPCCLTAAGFFPISMQTATTLMSSTMSYFTLMRSATE